MPLDSQPSCPECAEPNALDRRNFLRSVGQGTAAVLALGATGSLRRLRADDAPPKPAEALIKELYASMSDEQKKDLVLPWDHGATETSVATRLRMYNAPILQKTIGQSYTKAQQELNERILKAISSDDEGFKKLTRGGNYDTRGGFQGCGAVIFGEPVEGKKFSWVFTGHHLTVRCDGDHKDGIAFGGPMFYGHSPDGYSEKNVFQYQTKSVVSVFDALSEAQRKKAVVTGSSGEGPKSIELKKADDEKPGISIMDLSQDQRKLVETVMRDVLSPYRKEDANEVMDIVKANGGMDKIHLAFYQDKEMNDKHVWHFWRLGGPGFVWNYRVLPHVHTYVNISSKIY